MTPEQKERLKACAAEIAEIMYTNTPASELSSLETIEKHIREQWLELVGPEVGFFGVADLGYERLNRQVIETSIHKNSGFSIYFFHTLIKQRPDLNAIRPEPPAASSILSKFGTSQVGQLFLVLVEIVHSIPVPWPQME